MLDLELRKTGIGSSEVGAVLGLSPYQSPLDVWLEKRGEVAPWTGNEATRLGKRLEAPIIAEYAERTQQAVVPLFDQTFRHPEREWQLATPDAKLVSKPKLVEAKNVGIRMAGTWGEEGTDQVPEMYLVQGCWQMSTLDIPEMDFAALFGGNDFRIFPLRRDEELEKMLLDRVGKFWLENVLAGVMPEIRDTERTRAWIKAKYPRDQGLLRPATLEESDLMAKLRHVREAKALYEKAEEQLKLQVQAAIGEDEGIAGDGFKATWKLNNGKKEYVVKAQPPTRIFRPTWEDE